MASNMERETAVSDIDGLEPALKEMVASRSDLLNDPVSKADNRRILRRVDLHLLPILVFSYMLQYLDKSAMGYTAILGLRTDLHLTGSDYSWAGSIFNFGYLVASFPVALIMVRFPVGKFMAIAIALWAVILMCTGAVQNAGGLLACRFLLGFLEAAVAPGFSIITAMWYKRSEQPIRHGAWFFGNIISGLFGSSLAYGVSNYHAFSPWRFLFLVFGAVTFAWGLTLLYTLPDTPANARFLSTEDKVKAVSRTQENMTGQKHDQWKRYQVIEALTDIKAWLIVLIMLANNIPNGGVGNFASIVIKGFGFSTRATLLVQMIVTGFQGFFVIAATVASSYFTNVRTYAMAICTVIGLVGACCIRQLNDSNIWARYLAGYCLLSAYTCNFPLILTMCSANFGGFTKKATVNAMVFVAYCVGNIIGPQLFFAREAPSYRSGFMSMLICFGVGTIAILVLRFYLIWENRRRDKQALAPVEIYVDSASSTDSALHLVDMTDKELTQFRYVY